MMSWARKTLVVGGAFCLVAGMAMAQNQQPSAVPGMINYAEGQVTIDGQAVTTHTINSSVVQPGQVLRTDTGKAEMLLTPGVFLRMSDHSAVKMVSPSLTDTRVEVMQGESMVEADQVLEGNHLIVSDNGVDTQILKNGLYKFTTNPAQLSVYDGKAQAFIDERAVEVGKGKELALAAGGALKAQSFDRKLTDQLYQWSEVRSQYVAEANQSSVQYIVGGGYPYGWYGLGWYWNPWFGSYAFIPGAGFYGSPFGFGFYSPAYFRAYPPVGFYGRPGVAVRGGFAPAARVGGFGGFRGGRR